MAYHFFIVAKSFRLTTTKSGTLSDLNEELSNNYGSLPNITFYCDYDRELQVSTWKWIYDGQKHRVLPKCEIGCIEDPPPGGPPNITRTWVYEKHWESKFDRQNPIYECGEGKTY